MVMATQRIEIAALRLSAEQVIDTTAAGDSFSAAYLPARLQGADVTDAAAEAIRQMRAAYPDLLIGAGTVLNREQVDAAVAAGADFIVSPGFNPTTVQYCLDKDVTIIPGVNNPSLVEQAMEMGLRHLKFFPAEQSGGTAMLKALGAVYPVRFMPTGGVTPANLKEYGAECRDRLRRHLDGAGQAHRRGQVGRADRPGKRGRGGPVIIS
ncbi:hypothetical protein WP2W18C05_31680 [Aeromonas sp. WP2-W18-CRE-05]|nr:hypothetical protein WP2W18C05_31680 [Aeromonas sp. WP2-W18-CRE-05]